LVEEITRWKPTFREGSMLDIAFLPSETFMATLPRFVPWSTVSNSVMTTALSS
jgi:hypothetical protein